MTRIYLPFLDARKLKSAGAMFTQQAGLPATLCGFAHTEGGARLVTCPQATGKPTPSLRAHFT